MIKFFRVCLIQLSTLLEEIRCLFANLSFPFVFLCTKLLKSIACVNMVIQYFYLIPLKIMIESDSVISQNRVIGCISSNVISIFRYSRVQLSLRLSNVRRLATITINFVNNVVTHRSWVGIFMYFDKLIHFIETTVGELHIQVFNYVFKLFRNLGDIRYSKI